MASSPPALYSYLEQLLTAHGYVSLGLGSRDRRTWAPRGERKAWKEGENVEIGWDLGRVYFRFHASHEDLLSAVPGLPVRRNVIWAEVCVDVGCGDEGS